MGSFQLIITQKLKENNLERMIISAEITRKLKDNNLEHNKAFKRNVVKCKSPRSKV